MLLAIKMGLAVVVAVWFPLPTVAAVAMTPRDTPPSKWDWLGRGAAFENPGGGDGRAEDVEFAVMPLVTTTVAIETIHIT